MHQPQTIARYLKKKIIKFINDAISDMLSKTQYGGKKGVGTEHLLVNIIDKIKQLQDNPEKQVVVLN